MSPSLTTLPVSALPRGSGLSRYIMAWGLSKDLLNAKSLADEQMRDSPAVSRALELTWKASVGPIHSDPAQNPFNATGLAAEALGLVRDQSIVDLAAPKMRGVPLGVAVPRQLGVGAAGAWTGEAMSGPVFKNAYDTIRLAPCKPTGYVVYTKESFKLNNATAERRVRDDLVGSVTAFTDTQFLLPTVAATAINPASITHDGTAIVSSGTSAAALTADLTAMLAAITTTGRGLTWIMRPTTAAQIALALGAAAATLPKMLMALPVIVNANSPRQITLVDLAEVAFGDSGAFEVSKSDETALEMEDAPVSTGVSPGGSPDSPIATSLVSTWQDGLVAFFAMRWLNWLVLQSGAVAYMVTDF